MTSQLFVNVILCGSQCWTDGIAPFCAPKFHVTIYTRDNTLTLSLVQAYPQSCDLIGAGYNIDGYNDPKICYSKFLERYTKAYETHFPLKKLKRRLHFSETVDNPGLT